MHNDEIYKLTSTINQLLDRLEDAVLREKQFTADASHELRTPLSVIKGTLEVLIRKPREVDQYENKISYCITEVNRMSILIDQLLMLARYESGKIIPKVVQCKLGDKINPVLFRLQNQIELKNIVVQIENKTDNIFVKADPEMMDIIFENIISNSIKYSEAETNIKIKIENNNSTVICSIEDEGGGMTQEQAAKIFDRFYRADESRNSKITGNGLGLAIVKKLCDLQHIRISINSVPGKTTLSLYFPQ